MLSNAISASVILVDEHDEPTGIMEKLEAHEKGLLHRAFSVFVFNNEGHMLLQQRADGKYHSPGLWTNTCCSHPSPGESTMAAAHRRLKEEMGFDCGLEEAFHFTYRATFDNGLIEHEFDHVFIGHFNGEITPNPEEVGSYRYLPLADIRRWVADKPSEFTPWFKIALPEVEAYLEGRYPA
ncbi:isopentenyl-diphosphate Delta-isomerase [Chitinophaga horti]|uniref:Isopentenyl-diphosphate delta-isomerase n=1 Tax=Chitinophaga horti TaxID=2920382 RepID=A0ABY6IYS9_9BACT|nr:isopentenyl-diphosphate Delta-isomerase [Chitinophaga horti]UYQ92440.1 isopentenyl-diphosphate Delta-isomerase [Chitinophaga horti]